MPDMPPSFMPCDSGPILSCASWPAFSCASLKAPKTRSCRVSTSSGSTTDLSIFKSTSSAPPVMVTVTMPLPAVPSTLVARISSCAFCSSACTRAACAQMSFMSGVESSGVVIAYLPSVLFIKGFLKFKCTDFLPFHRGEAAMITNSQRRLAGIATACARQVLLRGVPWPLQWHCAYLNCLAHEHRPSSRFLVLHENTQPAAEPLTPAVAHFVAVLAVHCLAMLRCEPHSLAAVPSRHQNRDGFGQRFAPAADSDCALTEHLQAALTHTPGTPLALDRVAKDDRR